MHYANYRENSTKLKALQMPEEFQAINKTGIKGIEYYRAMLAHVPSHIVRSFLKKFWLDFKVFGYDTKIIEDIIAEKEIKWQ